MDDIDILVIGEINCDLVLRGSAVPEFGQVEKLVEDAELTVGSSSAIFACGAARLGLRVAFAGLVGDDTFGQFMLAALRARGVDVSGVRVDSALKTGLTVILSRGNDRAILTYPGTMAVLSAAHIAPKLLERARHVHVGGYYLLDALRPAVPALFATARAAGATTSLDTNYDPHETWEGGIREALAQTDVFLPNEAELLAITRQASVRAALEALGDRVGLIAVKCGARGARAWRRGEQAEAGVLPVALVDTTGAGDSFDAGLLYGYLNGWPLESMLRLGTACGSLSTRAAGGTAAQATLAEALRALQDLGGAEPPRS
jgi:sugar/nucleoside kinase (ribokinase family)